MWNHSSLAPPARCSKGQICIMVELSKRTTVKEKHTQKVLIGQMLRSSFLKEEQHEAAVRNVKG